MPRRFHLLRRNHDSSGNIKPSSVDSSTNDQEPSSAIKNRLHALFTTSQVKNNDQEPEAGPSRSSQYPYDEKENRCNKSTEHSSTRAAPDDGLIRSRTLPIDGQNGEHGVAQSVTIPKKNQRDAIKVLMVTWNMGDALPKGDLSVLFGQIPPYQPETPTGTIPKLPVENVHPYHIVVVAGQECPTLSGAPRGLGGGLVKGVTLRHKKDKEKEKDREKEKEKEKLNTKGKPELKLKKDTLEVDREDAGSRSADQEESSEDETPKESSERASRASSPMTPHTPFMHRGQPTAKGWSQMLDDYFCGINARTSEPLPSSYNSSSPVPSQPPFLPHPPPSAFPVHPSLLRSASAPITPVTSSIAVPPRAPNNILGTYHLALSPSPLARSGSSFESSSASSSTSEADESYLMINQRSTDNHHPPSSPSKNTEKDRPELIIPNEEVISTHNGNGSYVHVVKERLLGMYLTVYVYKGCEHLIQGTDKDLVTAGLAGGRVGNKGGIGISLKLADHRFLFINSHLAAHTGRMHARLSNISKIKSELRLDCFLPKDDPRATAEDITDRFDTVLWCGDLNFRIELSRLHADWLIEQKKYSELLMWDQLKLAMKDPNLNPFPGFEEGPIDFPCTFKYDVWKSVRATNREIRKSTKRRKSTASTASADFGSSANIAKNLSYVPEGDAIEEVDDDNPDTSLTRESLPKANGSDDEMTEGNFSRRSFESSRYTSGAGTDIEEDSDDIPATYRNQHQHQHRPFEVALKEKTRHLLGLVKMDGILTSSPRRPGAGIGRKVSVKRKISLKRQKDLMEGYESRRTSVSSFQEHTDQPSTPTSEGHRRVSTSSRYDGSNEGPMLDGLGLAPPIVESSSSVYSSSPPREKEKDKPPLTRRLSIMKRTMSNRSVKNASNLEDDDDEEEVPDEIDRREGVYDTSKKQRVPSWCDRVLWKSHITPDPEDDSSHAKSVRLDVDSHTPFHRLSNVFSNLGGHLKIQMTRTASMDPGPADRMNLRIRTSNSPEESVQPILSEPSLVASPPDSPTFSPKINTTGEGLIPLPRKPSPIRPVPSSSPSKDGKRVFFSNTAPDRLIPSMGIGMIRSGSAPGEHRPKLDKRPASASGNQNKITFDSPISPTVDTLRSGPMTRNGRVRSNSDSTGLEGKKDEEKKKGRISDGILEIDRKPTANVKIHTNSKDSSRESSPERKLLKIFDLDKRIRTISNSTPSEHKSSTSFKNLLHPSESSTSMHRISTIHTSTQPTQTSSTGLGVETNGKLGGRESDKHTFIKFIKDLPSWLHRSSSHAPEDILIHVQDQNENEIEKIWKKGEVRCLHYGTIDDAGMRLLEGRSDHRPAIFAGAVYV
uniref:Inositol polyphosphate-related phosphatase domain-containing protein n=1 Tax=Kwoniella pini CBS 10737 TaxID=1296096 RepID=A0A1B9I9B8_9TREE|nr:uncharacterized protein I206_01498 [Kwoniella pini CBS 10737]OCF52212.1 hypothetical protein I206_01498 [Kwoniella pini CBS 10737]